MTVRAVEGGIARLECRLTFTADPLSVPLIRRQAFNVLFSGYNDLIHDGLLSAILASLSCSGNFDEIVYFFYITNDRKKSAQQVIEFYRCRADHENYIEQLKNGVKALQMPSDTLESNWAFMVIASLAWDLKAWYGLLLPYRHLGLRVVRMEFKRFINTFINVPCLIVRTGRRIWYRIVGYNDNLKHMLDFSEMLRNFSLP